MWSAERKKLIEPRFLLALGVGVVLVVGIIVFSLFLRAYTPGHGSNRIDALIPRSAIVYAHLDLGLLSRADQAMRDNQSWQQLSAKVELAIKKKLPDTFDDQRLSKVLGQEAAFFVLPGNQGRAFIIEARSAKDFRTMLNELFPGSGETADYHGVTIGSRPADLFADLPFSNVDTKIATVLYWSEVKKGMFVIADSAAPIRAVVDVKNKDADALAATVSVYRPNTALFSLWLKPAGYDLATAVPEQFRTYFNADTTTETDLFFQVDLSDGLLVGSVTNHPATLLEKLSAGDASNIYRQAERYFPPSYRLAWLGINWRDVFQSLSAAEASTDKESIFYWPSFFTNEFRFDWAKHVLPLVNLQTDVIIGQQPAAAESPQAFLLTMQPGAPEELNDVANNIDALIKNVLSVLSPRKIEKTLSDGTTVTELVPDTQAGNQKDFHVDSQSIQKLWQIELPGGKNTLVYGQLDNRVVVSNAPAMIEAIAKQSSMADEPACVRKISGKRLLVVNRDQLLLSPEYGQYAARVFVADATKDQNIYLTFCIEPYK
ncbi:MAG: hypothetical protein WC497_02945 [Patescibacteria group bacterium]